MVSVQQPDNMSAKLQDVAFKAGRFRSEHIQMCIYYAMAQLQITEEKEEILILENENRTRSLEEDCHYNFWI